MNINLFIEHLVLTDVSLSSDQKHRFTKAVEIAAKRQLEINGADSIIQPNKTPSPYKSATISINNIHHTESLGQQIGNAIYRGIK